MFLPPPPVHPFSVVEPRTRTERLVAAAALEFRPAYREAARTSDLQVLAAQYRAAHSSGSLPPGMRYDAAAKKYRIRLWNGKAGTHAQAITVSAQEDVMFRYAEAEWKVFCEKHENRKARRELLDYMWTTVLPKLNGGGPAVEGVLRTYQRLWDIETHALALDIEIKDCAEDAWRDYTEKLARRAERATWPEWKKLWNSVLMAWTLGWPKRMALMRTHGFEAEAVLLTEIYDLKKMGKQEEAEAKEAILGVRVKA